MSIKKLVVAAVLSVSAFSFALDKAPPAAGTPPGGAGGFDRGGPGQWRHGGPDGEGPEGREAMERHGRMMMVVGIAEALELSEADALKLSDKLKGFDEKRKPIREAMHESMKVLRAAADGDQSALPQVDANVQKVLDGRAQMAALDKELFNMLATGQSPQKKARLALVMARMHKEMMKMGGGKGRHHRRH